MRHSFSFSRSSNVCECHFYLDSRVINFDLPDVKKAKKPEKTPQIIITQLFKPHAHTIQFFTTLGFTKDSLMTLKEIKVTLDAYYTKQNLIVKGNPKMINADTYLLNIFNNADEGVKFSRDVIVQKVVAKMREVNECTFNGVTTSREGPLAQISILMEKRRNKIITRVKGLEAYGVDLQDYAVEMRQKCASGVTVDEVKINGKDAGNELIVQGSKLKELLVSFEAFGIGDECRNKIIDVVDKIKK